MPVDPKKYVFEGPLNKLTKYISDANEDTLFIPMGTLFVGDGYNPIRGNNRPWDTVYIPKSVIKIDDCALPFVESIHYEGTAEEFAKIDKGDIPRSNFDIDFIPNYAKNTPCEAFSKVKEVKYFYNTNIAQMYKMLSEERAKRESLNTNIIASAQAFVSMCKKLDNLSRSPRNYYSVIKKEETLGSANFYITHTFHDVDWLEFACDSMRKGDTHMVKYYYDSLIGEKVHLTEKERGFFLNDYSDFCDFLNGGIEGWNVCKFNGLSDVLIEQYVGYCSKEKVSETHKELLVLTNNQNSLK